MLPRLSERERLPERMDDPDLDPDLHRAALAGLRRINRLSTVTRRLWVEIAGLARTEAARLRVLDVACGSGDTLCALARRATDSAIDIEWTGADISEVAVGEAGDLAVESDVEVSFITLDALRDPLPEDYDVVMSSLFLHHLDTAEAGRFLRRAGRAARRRLLVDDLVRGRAAHGLAVLGTRLLSRSPVVHSDGPLSVRAAFSISEIRALADGAGLDDVRVRRHWPFRFLLSARAR